MPGRSAPPTPESAAEPMQQRIDERARMHARAGMHHHPRGLIDGHQIVVLVEHGERNIFGCGAQGRRVGGLGFDRFPEADGMRGARRCAINQHAAVLNPALNAGAAELRQPFMEQLIQTLARVVGFGCEMQEVKWPVQAAGATGAAASGVSGCVNSGASDCISPRRS